MQQSFEPSFLGWVFQPISFGPSGEKMTPNPAIGRPTALLLAILAASPLGGRSSRALGPAGEIVGVSMEPKDHWEKIYTTKTATEVSWFQEHAQLSLKLIREAGVPTSASITDVGGGASTLVDDLLAHGYEHVTVLDLSGSALATARARLGERAA